MNMTSCKGLKTPIEKGNTEYFTENEPFHDKTLNQKMTGMLYYLAVTTRCDISFAVSKASSYNANPTIGSWKLIKRICRYLQNTKNHALTYKKNGNREILGFVDSDWATDSTDRRSVTGFVFTLASGAISWKSKKQTAVTLSSAEAEFVGLGTAASEAIFLRNLFEEVFNRVLKTEPTHVKLTGVMKVAEQINNEVILEENKNPIVICQDNQASIAVATNNSGSKRMKHIHIKHLFTRELVQRKLIKLTYIPTHSMAADFLTKATTGEIHERCRNEVGILLLKTSLNTTTQVIERLRKPRN